MRSRAKPTFCVALAASAVVMTVFGMRGAESAPAAASAESGAGVAAVSPSPAFDAKQLTALPTTNWITNGGTVFNQRYSPLSLLNRDNVGGLKALWRTGIGSGLEPGYAGEAQILVYGDTLYVVNGANDVVAMDVETGRTMWTYHGNPNPQGGSPLGRASRGVAIGDGKVFVGHTDARLAALDQRTGKVIWTIPAERWQDGFAITAAPLYYDGLVIVGFNGGEMGVRGRIKAYDAKTGALRWTFYTVPAPGEPGHETWPQNSDAWTHGGAAIWQTPAVDPALGLLYFSTGNPAPDLHGDVRAGNNLYSVSILALEAKTGKYRWHFQQVHHDIWDYDSPNPVVLFDTQINGKPVKGLVEVSKTGWAYILDRVTGQPLLGIQERPVPQEPRQATAATQPYPVGDSIVPQQIDFIPDGAHLAPGTTELPNKGRIFTPFWTEPVMAKPGTMGGANWPPSSYDPETHLLYTCASDRISVFAARERLEAPGPNKVYMGGAFTQAQVADAGILAALDVTTNRLVWRQQWREICFSGSVVTAGGLLFVGRADGRLTALDKSNGNRLWEFMTDAGVNTTVTTFEHKGKQYVVVHAGGGLFANGKRGDGVWMFSLDGKIPSLTPASAPRGGPPGGGPGGPGRPGAAAAAPPAPTRAANVTNGARIYKQACVPCHGATGEGGEGGGASLVKGLTAQSILSTATTGKNNMPSFTSSYSPDEINDVATYIVDVLAKAKQ
jgi:quinohemoprotein ethanol dehydrogenase